jgi:hypothetical protein
MGVPDLVWLQLITRPDWLGCRGRKCATTTAQGLIVLYLEEKPIRARVEELYYVKPNPSLVSTYGRVPPCIGVSGRVMRSTC